MPEASIEVRQLVHRYSRTDHPAVDGLDVTVAPGEIVGLLGPNGAGKTTTLHAVLGLLKPTSGTVKVFGHSPLSERSRVLPRMNFASVEVDLPSNLIVTECLQIFAKLYGVRRARLRMDELIERFDLVPLRQHLTGTLSAGEQMRLKLCKALLNAPDLLILDEPTLSLDPYMAQKVRELLKRIQRERQLTILHTSHNMREVETFCDRILFLHQGKKLAEGSPGEVLERFKSRSLDELFIRVATSGELLHAPS
jgi:ABC-2 type transport system ATP-binding protein